jgi:ATP-dependent Clp protease ATP-binding subunit ClpA
MATEQREPTIPTNIGPKVYVVIEKLAKNVYRARSLPPLKIDEMGSSERRLIERVRNLLPKKFRKLSAAGWARPMPGNNSQLAAPSIMTIQVPVVMQELKSEHSFCIDIEVVHWQIDEKNYCYFAPLLDRMLIGRPAHWEGEPIIREFRSEIERKTKSGGLDYIKNWLMGKQVSLHILKFPATSVTQERKGSVKKKAQLPTLKKTSSNIRTWLREPVYQRDELADQVASLLMSDVPQSVLLVGDAGVGKTAIVQQLPVRQPKLPPLWSTGGSQLVSGMCGWGMWQEQLQKLLSEIRKIEGVLHVGSLLELVEAGKIDDQPGVASLLKPEMQRGKVRVIAECTPDQYQKLESQDPALLRCFLRIDVSELSQADNIKLLQKAAENLLQTRQVELARDGHELRLGIDEGVIEALYALSKRYCGYSPMPGIPLRLLRSVIGTLANGEQVTASRMLQAFSTHTGLPRFLIDDEIPLDYQELQQRLARRVVGQSEPVELIANMITTLKSRLQRPEKPLASFLFIGPTGVGKTEMGKTLAEVLFGDSNRMLRIDMSEYATPWSIGRLTGISAQDSGTLTGPILDQPFSLILLDEIEKAHPSVFDLLLQVLGEGRLTDTAGRRADFRSSVIIMTSNLGVESFRAIGTGFSGTATEDYREHFEREVRRYVRPELLGRLDRIVPFRTLSRDHVCAIARRELEKVWMRPGVMYGKWQIQVADEVLQWVAERGYQPQYGARPLRRAIEDHIVVPVSKFLVNNKPNEEPNADQRTLVIELKENEISVVEKSIVEKQVSENLFEVKPNAEQKRISAAELDQWRHLRHKALLTLSGADVRTANGNLDRIERQLKEYERKIKKTSDETRRSALISAQGFLLSNRKLISERLSLLESKVQRIAEHYPAVLKAFLNGDPINKHVDAGLLEVELRNAMLDLDVEREKATLWSFFYWGAPISDFRFLIESHAQRFRAKQTFWLLYDSKKFAKLKKEEKLPNAYKDTDIRIWIDAELTAARNTKSLGEVSLDHAIGLAFEATPSRQNAQFIEDEYGVHFLRKRESDTIHKLKMKVQLFPSNIESIHLPSGFRDMQFPSGLDPVRQYFPVDGVVVHVPTKQSVVIGSGTLAAAVQKLMERIQEEAVWNRVGFKPLPVSSNATSRLF